MPTNIYSVEAEITRNVVVEVEATSMEEAKDLVAADPDGYDTKKDDRTVSIGSTTFLVISASTEYVLVGIVCSVVVFTSITLSIK